MSSSDSSLRPCVLVGGAWGGVYGFLRSLGPRGVPVYVVAFDQEDADIYAASHYARGVCVADPDTSGSDLCRQISKWVARHHGAERPVLIPLNDQSSTVVAESRETFDEAFDVILAGRDLVMDMLDKTRANDVAEANGLTLPKSEFVNSAEELDAAMASLRMPVIVKPTWWREKGETTFKAEIRYDRDEALADARELVADGAKLIIQEYIPGDDRAIQVYMFYRSFDGSRTFGCTGVKWRQMPLGAGIMASGEARRSARVEEACLRFLERSDYRGLGGIEFKYHEGCDYFIEMSVRPEGFHALAIQAGVDTPWLAYQDVALGVLPAETPRQRPAFFVDDLAYFRLCMRYWRHRRVWTELVSLLLSGNVWRSLWTGQDIGPALRAVQNLGGRAFRKIGRKFAIFGRGKARES
jgi:D-aspartate ligase